MKVKNLIHFVTLLVNYFTQVFVGITTQEPVLMAASALLRSGVSVYLDMTQTHPVQVSGSGLNECSLVHPHH